MKKVLHYDNKTHINYFIKDAGTSECLLLTVNPRKLVEVKKNLSDLFFLIKLLFQSAFKDFGAFAGNPVFKC